MKRKKIVSLEDAINLVHKQLAIKLLSSKLIRIQGQVFAVHAKIESLIEKRIAIKILSSLGKELNKKNISKAQGILDPFFRLINFAQKLKILKSYKDFSDGIKEIIELNNYRVEFAHKDPSYLEKKYLKGPNAKKNMSELRKTIMSAPLEFYIYLKDIVDKYLSEYPDDKIPF